MDESSVPADNDLICFANSLSRHRSREEGLKIQVLSGQMRK